MNLAMSNDFRCFRDEQVVGLAPLTMLVRDNSVKPNQSSFAFVSSVRLHDS